MGSNLFAYIQQLEMLAFFSGYPLIYFLVRWVIQNLSTKKGWNAEVVSVLPYAYALIGTLYLVLQLINLYPDYTIENIQRRIQQPFLHIWAVMAIIFWIPVVARKTMLSIVHSLIFFLFIARDLFFQFTGFSRDQNVIRNDMRIYTISIFLNLIAFTILALLFFLLDYCKKK